MDLELHSKVVFISGSTQGIGFETAKVFLDEKAIVYINGRTDESVNQALNKLKELGYSKNFKGIVADLSDVNAIDIIANEISHLDILVNNVGIYRSQDFQSTTSEDWSQQMQVNLLSGVQLSKKYLPKMLSKNWGRIVFVSSECAFLIPSDLISYSVTKSAMLSLSRGLAQLTKKTNLTVNTVIPGSTLTEGAQEFIRNKAKENKCTELEAQEEFFKQERNSSLIQRFINPREIANTIAFLSSPLASAINGSTIKADGGSIGGLH